MAAATIMTATNYSVFFKNRYPQRKIEDLVAYGKPWYSQLSKSDELVGVTTYIPLQFDSPQGMSPSLVQALTNVSPTQGVAWAISPFAYYAGLTIDAKTMLASRNNEGAFFRAREREVENILEQMGQEFEKLLWRDGSGSIGQISGDASGAGPVTITLTNAADAINFHKNMKLTTYSNSSGVPGTYRTNVGVLTVASVDEDAGTIVVTETVHADSATLDHLVRDSGTGAGGINNVVSGIPAWIPAAAPTSTPFKGVDRSVAPQKLGGWRQSWLGTIEETAKRLDAKIRRANQKPKELWLSYDNFNRLDLELGARGYRFEDGSQGKFGRPSLMMTTPGGGVMVKAGPYVPNDTGFLLTPDTWKLLHLGGLPHLVQDDGQSAVRIGGGVASTAVDGIEIRWRAFFDQVCLNPYANGRFPIS